MTHTTPEGATYLIKQIDRLLLAPMTVQQLYDISVDALQDRLRSINSAQPQKKRKHSSSDIQSLAKFSRGTQVPTIDVARLPALSVASVDPRDRDRLFCDDCIHASAGQAGPAIIPKR